MIQVGAKEPCAEPFHAAGAHANRDMKEMIVRRAEPKDLNAILAIETESWPAGDGMRAGRGSFASRIELKFVWVICDDGGRVVGMFTAFRPSWVQGKSLDDLLHACPIDLFDTPAVERWTGIAQKYHLARNWHEATAEGTLKNGALHHPHGDVLFGVGLAIDPQHIRKGLARTLLRTVFAEAARDGVRYFLGYGRLPMFHHHRQIDVDTYLAMTDTDAGIVRPCDAQLRFFCGLGAKPIRSTDGRTRYVGIPQAMREDPESRGYGLLTILPLGATPFSNDSLSK